MVSLSVAVCWYTVCSTANDERLLVERQDQGAPRRHYRYSLAGVGGPATKVGRHTAGPVMRRPRDVCQLECCGCDRSRTLVDPRAGAAAGGARARSLSPAEGVGWGAWDTWAQQRKQHN